MTNTNLENYMVWLVENTGLSYECRRDVVSAWYMDGQITMREACWLLEFC